MRFPNNVLLIFLISILALTTGLLIGQFVDETPKAAQAQKELEYEFQSIKPLPGAASVRFHASHKTHQALVGCTYLTEMSYTEIKKHYDSELAVNGWEFQRDEIPHWRRDQGARILKYTKGDYTASLTYSGEKADYGGLSWSRLWEVGWVYGLDLSWGLDKVHADHRKE